MRNFNLEELFVGAWVRKFLPDQGRFTCPLRVSGIFGDGSIYLDFDGNDGDPFDANVTAICPIPMDEDTMRGFGFVRVPHGDNVWMRSVDDIRLTVSLRQRHGEVECRRAAISGRFACWNEEIRYIHELQRWWTDKVLLPYGVQLDMIWTEPEKDKEELI